MDSQDKYSQFICSNTLEMTMDEMETDHIIPVHIKDNEQAISHMQFIESVSEVGKEIFGEAAAPLIRVSHPIKGRIPEARNKPAKDLLPEETTLYYERMAWMINFPSITSQVGDEVLELTIGGVKAYNLDNLYSTKDTHEHFKLFVGFKNNVCTNLCVATTGLLSDLRVNSVEHLKASAYQLFESFQMFQFEQQIQLYDALKSSSLTEAQFAHLLGRVKLYNSMPKKLQKEVPPLGLSDSQLSMVASDYYQDKSHCRSEDSSISLWNVYNLFTGATKSSYIDTFLDRNVQSFSGVIELMGGLQDKRSWYLDL